MTRNSSLVIAIALALGISTVAAASSGMTAEDRAEAAAVVHASVTPTHAIQIAEQAGGRAYALGFESSKRGNWYEVEVLLNDAPTEVRIDPTSGKVLGTSKATGEGAKGAHALDQNKLTLAAAVTQAEHTGHGTAMEATSMGSGTNAYVIVDVVQGRNVAHYRVSMRNGQIEATSTTQGAG